VSLAAAAAAAIDNAQPFEAASRREHWLAASRAITNALLEVVEPDQALRLVAGYARGVGPADFAAVVVPNAGEVIIAAADGLGAARVTGAVVPSQWSPAGQAIRGRAAVVYDDLGAQDQLRGPMKDLGVGPIMALPLSARGQVLGALAVGNLPGRAPFTAEDVEMAGDFAALVLTVAAARTAAREAEMVEERARIARDLHDHAIQRIFAAGLGIQGLAGRLGGQPADQLVGLVDQLDEAIKDIRTSIFSLQAPRQGPRSPHARLLAVADQAAASLGFPPHVRTHGPVDTAVPPPVAEDLLAVLREALSNTARHAGAGGVEVRITADTALTLHVRDDGHGIGTPARASGLANMRHRAEAHGGAFEAADAPGGGALVHWSVPLTAAPSPPSEAPPPTSGR
jgi:two-component system, NarL family, sensor histidine kinase DevS